MSNWADSVTDMMDEHDSHLWEQVGPCVYCQDCNVRLFQGRLTQPHPRKEDR